MSLKSLDKTLREVEGLLKAAKGKSKPMTKKEVLASLKAGEDINTSMLKPLGMSMDHFLRYASLSPESQKRALEKLTAAVEASLAKEEPKAEVKASKVKASDYDYAHNKVYLRKLKRIVDRGYLAPDEIAGAIVEALRLAKVSSRMAGAIADKIKSALVDAEEVVDVSASRRK